MAARRRGTYKFGARPGTVLAVFAVVVGLSLLAGWFSAVAP